MGRFKPFLKMFYCLTVEIQQLEELQVITETYSKQPTGEKHSTG